MKKMFAKTTLALAVAGVMAAPAFAVDGVDYTGNTARSQALQLDYYSHADRDNIWVNPALAADYRNSVEVNLRSNGAHTGGLLYGIGDNHTVGVYINRPSTSNFGNTTQLSNYNPGTTPLRAGNPVGLSVPNGTHRNTPDNMFDAFYAIEMGEMAFGARLSVQMVEETQNNPARTGAFTGTNNNGNALTSTANDNAYMAGTNATITDDSLNWNNVSFNGLTGSSLIAKLDQQIAAGEAARLTQHGAAPTGRVLTGSITEISTSGGNWTSDAKETNLALGFNLKSLGIDGALQFGTASGQEARSVNLTGKTTQYLANPTAPTTQATRVTSESSGTWKDVAEIDGGTSIALSLRGLLMQTDSSTLHASFLYSTQDYSGKLTSTRDAQNKQYENFQTGANFATADKVTTETITERYEGKRINEEEVIQLGVAFRNMISDSTALTAVAGFRMETDDTGREVSRVQHATKTDVVDAAAPNTTATAYTGAMGTYSRFERTDETMSLPVTLALEHSFNERWTLRAAASKNIYSKADVTTVNYDYESRTGNSRTTDANNDAITKTNNVTLNNTTKAADSSVQTATRTTTTETITSGAVEMSVGVGYTRGNVTIDTHFQNAFLLSSDNTKGGFGGVAPFGAATVTYNW